MREIGDEQHAEDAGVEVGAPEAEDGDAEQRDRPPGRVEAGPELQEVGLGEAEQPVPADLHGVVRDEGGDEASRPVSDEATGGGRKPRRQRTRSRGTPMRLSPVPEGEGGHDFADRQVQIAVPVRACEYTDRSGAQEFLRQVVWPQTKCRQG